MHQNMCSNQIVTQHPIEFYKVFRKYVTKFNINMVTLLQIILSRMQREGNDKIQQKIKLKLNKEWMKCVHCYMGSNQFLSLYLDLCYGLRVLKHERVSQCMQLNSYQLLIQIHFLPLRWKLKPKQYKYKFGTKFYPICYCGKQNKCKLDRYS